jgi:hypothetical protein
MIPGLQGEPGKQGKKGERGYASDRKFRIAISVWLAVFTIIVIFAVHSNHSQGALIQRQRVESVVRGCQDQNRRHRHAVRALNKLLTKSGVRKARREAASETILTFIDALAPLQNCLVLAQIVVPNSNPTTVPITTTTTPTITDH